MELRRIGVFLEDELAAVQLVEYWDRKAPQYRFEVFHEASEVREGLEEEPLYLLMTDETCFLVLQTVLEGAGWSRRIGRIVFLVDEECAGCMVAGESFPCIFRYQSADRILADAVGMREEKPQEMGEENAVARKVPDGGEKRREEGRVQVIGIYSPVGRCGKSRFALALGKVFAEQKRTLYMSLEVFSDLYEWLVSSGAGDFSDLLYYEELGALTEKRWQQLTVNRQGLFVTGPAVNPEDVVGLTAERCGRILRSASEAGFEVIVLDIGSQHPDPGGILALCERVFAPVTGEEVSRLKWQHFVKYLKHSGRETLLEQTETVRLPEAGCGYLAGGFPDCTEAMEAFVRRLACCRN